MIASATPCSATTTPPPQPRSPRRATVAALSRSGVPMENLPERGSGGPRVRLKTQFLLRVPGRAACLVTRFIGDGAYGQTYLCTEMPCDANSKRYALKIFKRKNDKEAERLLAMDKATLTHPNIIKVLHVSSTPLFKGVDHGYMIMEYADNGELFDFVEKGGPFGDRMSCLYIKQLLSSLVHLHGRQTYHRDIKPENLLVDRHGVLRLCDFGFSKTVEPALVGPELLTRTSTVGVGTPEFSPPEVKKPDHASGCASSTSSSTSYFGDPQRDAAHGYRQSDPDRPEEYDPAAVDIWSVGAVAFVLLACQHPLGEGNEDDLLLLLDRKGRPDKCHKRFWGEWRGRFKRMRRRWPFSASASDFVNRALQLEPTDRPSALQLLNHPWIQSSGPLPSFRAMASDLTRRCPKACFERPPKPGPIPAAAAAAAAAATTTASASAAAESFSPEVPPGAQPSPVVAAAWKEVREAEAGLLVATPNHDAAAAAAAVSDAVIDPPHAGGGSSSSSSESQDPQRHTMVAFFRRHLRKLRRGLCQPARREDVSSGTEEPEGSVHSSRPSSDDSEHEDPHHCIHHRHADTPAEHSPLLGGGAHHQMEKEALKEPAAAAHTAPLPTKQKRWRSSGRNLAPPRLSTVERAHQQQQQQQQQQQCGGGGEFGLSESSRPAPPPAPPMPELRFDGVGVNGIALGETTTGVPGTRDNAIYQLASSFLNLGSSLGLKGGSGGSGSPKAKAAAATRSKLVSTIIV